MFSLDCPDHMVTVAADTALVTMSELPLGPFIEASTAKIAKERAVDRVLTERTRLPLLSPYKGDGQRGLCLKADPTR